jgi:hypothetical protein
MTSYNNAEFIGLKQVNATRRPRYTSVRLALNGRPEQAERSSGIAAEPATPMSELRRQGSLLRAYEKINSVADRD